MSWLVFIAEFRFSFHFVLASLRFASCIACRHDDKWNIIIRINLHSSKERDVYLPWSYREHIWSKQVQFPHWITSNSHLHTDSLSTPMFLSLYLSHSLGRPASLYERASKIDEIEIFNRLCLFSLTCVMIRSNAILIVSCVCLLNRDYYCLSRERAFSRMRISSA
jgi:hypothetical protein